MTKQQLRAVKRAENNLNRAAFALAPFGVHGQLRSRGGKLVAIEGTDGEVGYITGRIALAEAAIVLAETALLQARLLEQLP